jgi:hypothetical protein
MKNRAALPFKFISAIATTLVRFGFARIKWRCTFYPTERLTSQE